jgi:hypothetical protein
LPQKHEQRIGFQGAFLKTAAVAGAVGVAGGFVGPSVSALVAAPTTGGKKDDLTEALANLLDYGVQGVERNHHIGSRLAVGLNRAAARPHLLRAVTDSARTKAAYRHERTVSENLNDLIAALRAQSTVPNRFIDALIENVLFSTHAVHFEDTRLAHRRCRQATLALKNRKSAERLDVRIVNKRIDLADYRRAIAAHSRQISLKVVLSVPGRLVRKPLGVTTRGRRCSIPTSAP